jgi:hypothetical protein
MNSTDMQSKIQAAATNFTNEIAGIIGEAFAGAVANLTVKAAGSPKPKAKAKPVAPKKAPAKIAVAAAPKAAKKPLPAAKAPVAKPAKPGKRIRRSENQLVADGDRVVKLLQANKKGLRIEQINKSLGTATKELARPILKLLEDGKIKKSGEKRATMYFPG